MERIPLAWIEQLAPGGAMLVNLRGNYRGVLCLLRKEGEEDEVIGPVLAAGGNFMWMRTSLDNPLRTPGSPIVVKAQNVSRRTTRLSPGKLLDDDSFNWMLQLSLPDLEVGCTSEVFDPLIREGAPGLLLYASDGSHAQVLNHPESDGSHRVIQSGGHRKIWDTVESVHEQWQAMGKPSSSRFGVVATTSVQFVWLDSDHSWQRWPLPLS